MSETGKKSVKVNYIYNLAYQMLLLVTPFITTPYVARVLGVSGVGAYSYTTAVVTYFILIANMGTNYYGSREIAYYQNDIEKRSRIFWEVIILRCIMTAVSLSIYWGFTHNSEYATIFSIQSIAIVAVLLDISWFFTGIEEFKITVTRDTIVKVTSIALIFLFVKDRNDLWLYVLIIVGAALLGNASFWFYIPKYIKKYPINKLKPFRDIKIVLQLFIPFVATQIYVTGGKVILEHFDPTALENGYYEQAEKIVKISLALLTTLGTVMVPRYAYLFKNGKWEEIQRYLKKGFSFVWLVGIPIWFGIISISNSFVPWFLGEGYEKVIALLYIFPVVVLVIGLSNVLGTQYLIPTSRQNHYTVTVIIGAIINVILCLILIPKYFSLGAVIALVLTETSITISQIIILRKEIPMRTIFGTAKKYLVAGLLMFLVTSVLGMRVPETVGGTAIVVVVGVTIYGGALLILKDEFVRGISNSILDKMKKR